MNLILLLERSRARWEYAEKSTKVWKNGQKRICWNENCNIFKFAPVRNIRTLSLALFLSVNAIGRMSEQFDIIFSCLRLLQWICLFFISFISISTVSPYFPNLKRQTEKFYADAYMNVPLAHLCWLCQNLLMEIQLSIINWKKEHVLSEKGHKARSAKT